jgi:DNA-binding phage protein
MGLHDSAKGNCTCTPGSNPYNYGMASFTQQLRRAIQKSRKTRYRIAQESGVSEATLCRFVHGSNMRTDTVDPLVETLGLELRPRRRKGR